MELHEPGDNLDERLVLLVQQVAEGKVVPFLGAGFSSEATDPSIDQQPATRIRTPELTRKLIEPLVSARDEGLLTGLVNPEDVDHSMPFGKAAELYAFLWGREKMVECLGFGSWGDLWPALSHQGVALLVLEGLVEEIITTNYDCLIEKAVRGLHRVSSADPSPCQVISDVDQYQEHGARRGDGRGPVLNLFKVNGCLAACSCDEGDDADTGRFNNACAAERLALCEEDVQEWRNKAWARDLVRDRMRSRSLLFVGFEGEDPIVRHHVVTVVGESRSGQGGDGSGRQGESERAQIYVAAFEEHLSFAQLQMLRVRHAPIVNGAVDELEQCGAVRQKAFTGQDEPRLRPKYGEGYAGLPNRLGADLFMAELVARVLEWVIIERYLADESPVASYLSGLLDAKPGGLLKVAREVLLQRPGSGGTSKPGDGDSLLASWLRPHVGKCPRSVLNSDWARFVGCLDGLWKPGDESCPSHPDGYRAFMQSPVKLPLALLIVALLVRQDLSGSEGCPPQVEWRLGPFAGICTTCGDPSERASKRLILLADLRDGTVEGLRQPLEQVRLAGGGSFPGGMDLVQQAVVITLARPDARPAELFLTGSTRRDDTADDAPAASIQVIPDWKLLQGSRHRPAQGVRDVQANVRAALAAPLQVVEEEGANDSWRNDFSETSGQPS